MGLPHYTPTGIPRTGFPSSSQQFFDEFKETERGMEAMNVFPMTIFSPDINSAVITDTDLLLVVPWDGIFTDVAAVIHADNATNLTSCTTEINGTPISQFFLRPLATDKEGQIYLNTFNQNQTPVADRTVVAGDIIGILRGASPGTSVMPMTFTYFLVRT